MFRFSSSQRLLLVLGFTLILLSVSVVLAMQVVGVILAAAVLVLPGAAALHLSTRLSRVMIWSIVLALGGTILGFVVGDLTNWPIGPSIVLVQAGAYAVALGSNKAMGVLRS